MTNIKHIFDHNKLLAEKNKGFEMRLSNAKKNEYIVVRPVYADTRTERDTEVENAYWRYCGWNGIPYIEVIVGLRYYEVTCDTWQRFSDAEADAIGKHIRSNFRMNSKKDNFVMNDLIRVHVAKEDAAGLIEYLLSVGMELIRRVREQRERERTVNKNVN